MITAGIDIGSLSAKALIMEDDHIVGWNIIFTGPDSEETAKRVMDEALNRTKLSLSDFQYVVSTGYGRVNVPFAQERVSEISCHARGSNWLLPQVRTILDMGGQDCKAIRCDQNGRVANFVMNDKCAAGTGRYMERTARALQVDLGQVGPLSQQTVEGPASINSVCTVFAQEDVIRLLHQGKHINDILAGVCDSLVKRVLTLLQTVNVVPTLALSGGIAKNIGIVKRLEQKLGLQVYVAPEPQIVGALGACLFARDKALKN